MTQLQSLAVANLRTIQSEFDKLAGTHPNVWASIAEFHSSMAQGKDPPRHLEPDSVLVSHILPGPQWVLPLLGQRSYRPANGRIGVLYFYGDKDGVVEFMRLSRRMAKLLIGTPWPAAENKPFVLSDLSWPRLLLHWALTNHPGAVDHAHRWSRERDRIVDYVEGQSDHFYSRAINLAEAAVYGINVLLGSGHSSRPNLSATSSQSSEDAIADDTMRAAIVRHGPKASPSTLIEGRIRRADGLAALRRLQRNGEYKGFFR